MTITTLQNEAIYPFKYMSRQINHFSNSPNAFIFFIALCFLIIKPSFAQLDSTINTKIDPNDIIDPNNYNHELFEQTLLNKLNETLKEKGKDTFRIKENLHYAAEDQATYMAKYEKVTTFQTIHDRAYTALRVQHYNGSRYAREMVTKVDIIEDKNHISYNQACSNLINKLFENKKTEENLLNKQFNLIGLGAIPDSLAKRVYVSIVLGNFKSDNAGAKKKYALNVPYSDGNNDLVAAHKKYCRKIDRKENVYNFQNNLKVENNTIYYESNNAKDFNRLIKNKHDGIAVDILQKDQFPYTDPNIINYNFMHKGILTKPIYTKKIQRKNKANTDKNKYALSVKLGKLPKELTEPYELNLVLIQNNSFCVSIPQNFIIKANGEYHHTAEYILNNSAKHYAPKADSIELYIKIPFERNKFTFNSSDIEPYINLLNEPNFTIYNINLKAFSSIEGNKEKNLELQNQRKQSILEALQQRQQEPIKTQSNSDFNWSDFKNDVQGTPYEYLAELSINEAQNIIEKEQLNNTLEPILKNHRYAELKMQARYNIEGENELPFVLNKYQRAIKENDPSLAHSIQLFIIEKVLQSVYHDSVICNINIPSKANFTSLKFNQLYILYQSGKITENEFFNELTLLKKLNPNDAYANYNHLLCSTKLNDYDYLEEHNDAMQPEIDKLYASKIDDKVVDALNIKYQLKILSNEKAKSNTKLTKQCINILHNVVDIQEETLNNTKRLASIFTEYEEYNLAKDFLAFWIPKCDDEALLFSYLSLCSKDEWSLHTELFNTAMLKASQINKERFCGLFYSDKFSYRVFENNESKALYCKTCTAKQNLEINDNELLGKSK